MQHGIRHLRLWPSPLAAALLLAPAFAQEPDSSGWSVRAGADLRLREELFDDIPILADPPGVTRGGANNYLRIRSRVWLQAGTPSLTLYGRMASEVRHWFDPDGGSYEWPDELVLDNLYLRLADVFGEGTVLTLGRQDIVLGSRRMVIEGTPKDGSRTIYMNGAAFKADLSEFTRLNLFGVYNAAEDELAIGHEHRDVTGYKSTATAMDEGGGGIYLTSRLGESLVCEVSYLYKHDTAHTIPGGTPVRVEDADYHTVGVRLMPQFTSTLSGELEVAGQFGDEGGQDVEAMLAAASLAWAPEARFNPSLSANLLYLSGDDPDTGRQEGWNPLWGRCPWVSELYIFSWDAEKAGFWTNLLYPYLQAVCSPAEGQKLRLSLGPLLAEEQNGPGGGDLRGWLGIARWDFPIAKGLLGSSDDLSGHLLAEVLDPGDYYKVDNTAYFLRWEVLYRY